MLVINDSCVQLAPLMHNGSSAMAAAQWQQQTMHKQQTKTLSTSNCRACRCHHKLQLHSVLCCWTMQIYISTNSVPKCSMQSNWHGLQMLLQQHCRADQLHGAADSARYISWVLATRKRLFRSSAVQLQRQHGVCDSAGRLLSYCYVQRP